MPFSQRALAKDPLEAVLVFDAAKSERNYVLVRYFITFTSQK